MNPTPAGVPVRMTLPASSVVPRERNEINAGTSNTMSLVLPSCLTSPLILHLMSKEDESMMS